MQTPTDKVIHNLEESLAEDIITINISEKSALCDEMIICTARSSTHARAIASSVHQHFKTTNINSRLEGSDGGEWLLVDTASVMVHVMQDNIRQYYDLESLWSQDILQT